MKSVIITESYFGNTATIAEELSAGLTSAGAEASVITAEEALEAPAAGTSATSGTRIIVVSTTTGGSMAGSAAKAAVKGLKKKRVAATRGEDFTVTDVPGPLAAGENERARAWARTLL